jgi:hypothetical protein
MASINPRFKPRGRREDDPNFMRVGGVMEPFREKPRSSLPRLPRREINISSMESPSSSQVKTPRRIPQPPSSRRPSNPGASRPPLTHETQSWGSTSSGSGRSTITALTSSPSLKHDRDIDLKQHRNVLRRKESSVSKGAPGVHHDARSNSGGTSSSSSFPKSQASHDPRAPQLDRTFTESPVEIRVAQQVELPKAVARTTVVYPELDRYRDVQIPKTTPGTEVLFKLATQDLPPPTPLFSGTSSAMSAFSGSPSTRFSESPGTGPYSRDTTPTSMSSASPGLIAPTRTTASRGRQTSPAETRPPVSRRRAGSFPLEAESVVSDTQGLAVVREALTSSSSNSTVRDGDRKEKGEKKRPPPTPPNPPPRKSSQRFHNDRSEERNISEPAKKPANPVTRSPSPARKTAPLRKGSRPIMPPSPRPTPPSRPSRDGTPDLHSQFGGPMPIIHSNLSSTSISDRRQSGQIVPSSLPKSTTIRRASQDSSFPSQSNIGREPTPVPQAYSGSAQTTRGEPGRPVRTPSPGVSTFRSKFGFFGRKAKTDAEASKADKKEKTPRKGPAAGTGHEGYGRLGAVKRRSSNTAIPSQGLHVPTGSAGSLNSAPLTDPFLLERLNPVIISGGEVIENRNVSSELSRTESNQSLPVHHGYHSRNDSAISSSSQDDGNTLWPSALPRNTMQSRRPSDSSDSEAITMKTPLAFRRSVQRARSSSNQQQINVPKPIVTTGITSPSMGNLATAVLTDDSTAETQTHIGQVRGRAAAQSRKLTKRAKSPKKWNLFSRSRSQPAAPARKAKEADLVPATVTTVPGKPVAFYTIMDSSEQEDTEDQDITDVLRAADVLPPRPPAKPTKTSSTVNHTSEKGQGQDQSAHQQTPVATFIDDSTQPMQTRPATPPTGSEPVDYQKEQVSSMTRPSRLPQVGRIPKVVASRPEHASPRSFSRPFHRVSVQFSPSTLAIANKAFIAKGPSPPEPSTPEPVKDARRTAIVTGSAVVPRRSHRQSFSIDIGQLGNSFLAFPPRKDSGSTGTTTSSSSGIPSYAQHIAVIPTPTAPLAEDEIWDEYNDLLGEAPPSATSSRGAPFHLDIYESRLAKRTGKAPEPPLANPQDVKDIRDSIEAGKAATSSSHYSGDMASRIKTAFRIGNDSPPTPFSISEFVSGYGDRNNTGESSNVAVSSKRGSSSSRKSSRLRVSNASTSSEETPLSQVNLRVGSMTVSKWLTFGHVLFSPAKEDIVPVVGSLKRSSILVIDGLGNDDWSFYAAETYPAATFYNLSPRAPLSEEHRTSTSFPMSPPNHHQIQYTSHLDKFPFAPDSFTTVVYRFPAAGPESYYRNIISEARRVLKPGGYVELSILDVDLNNMGNRTRRGVRRLKEKVNAQNSDINLSSTADLMIRLLGNKGFIDIKSCRVGVPVASAVTSASGSEGGKKKKDERSLAEMMNDETESGDENITKMVAKVGRWWYNRLYEASTGISPSVWHDRALLAECEEWQTTLKLMVCHARVPRTRARVSSI